MPAPQLRISDVIEVREQVYAGRAPSGCYISPWTLFRDGVPVAEGGVEGKPRSSMSADTTHPDPEWIAPSEPWHFEREDGRPLQTHHPRSLVAPSGMSVYPGRYLVIADHEATTTS